MPAGTRSPTLKTSLRRAGTRGDDRGFYMYVIAMLAVGNAVAVIFVLKTAIYLLF